MSSKKIVELWRDALNFIEMGDFFYHCQVITSLMEGSISAEDGVKTICLII